MVGDWYVQRIVQTGVSQEYMNWHEDLRYQQGRRPLVFQDVQAYSTELVNVRVIDLCAEKNLRWAHRVIIWEVDFKLEFSCFINCVGRTLHFHQDVSVVVSRSQTSCYEWRWSLHENVDFLNDSWQYSFSLGLHYISILSIINPAIYMILQWIKTN